MNILTLMGVALDARKTPFLVMPFMSNGSLCEYLRKEDVRKELLWETTESAEMVVKVSFRHTKLSVYFAFYPHRARLLRS